MQVGNKVRIKNTDSIFDNKEGLVEWLDDDGSLCTVFVDFIPEENKKVRQDFSVDNLEIIQESLKEEVEDDLSDVENGTFTAYDTAAISEIRDAKRRNYYIEYEKHPSAGMTRYTITIDKTRNYDGSLKKTISEDNDIDLKNDETQYQNHIREELANYFDCDIEEVVADDDHQYEVEGSTYWVGTYDEAYAEAVRLCKDLIDDLGLESFSEDYRDYVINNFLDMDTIRGWMQDSYESYVNDIEYESDSQFGNRLIQEMFDAHILTEDDFERDEDGDIIYSELKDSVDLDDKKVAFTSYLAYNEDPIEWLHELYDDEDLAKLIKRNGLLDVDACAEDCVDTDGIAHQIASYDGREIQIRDDLYAYRLD